MANSDGSMRVLAALSKQKTEKNSDDSRTSITSLRVGLASGTQGPFTFLAKGTRMDRQNIKNILSSRCPTGSQVLMCPSAYMTDETWIKLVPEFCRGIRAMPVIKDHPEWWMTLTLDGYSSHINCNEALEEFARNKIQIVKEEGDTSHVNQAYDQDVAKKDKTHMKNSLNLVRRKFGNMRIDQWILIAIAIEAQLQVTANDWITSHKRVNTQPSTRVPFLDFIKKLDERGILLSGEKFFEKRTSLMDAMPACWQKLSVEDRREVMTIIKNVYDLAVICEDPVVWNKETVCGLAAYVKLDDVHKLRACYHVALKDPSVLVNDEAAALAPTVSEEEEEVDEEELRDPEIRDFFHWQPKNLMDEYLVDKTNKEVQLKLFYHMTNFTAQTMWNAKRNQPLEPAGYLDINMSDDQRDLLMPSYKNVLQGFILYDVKGKGAKNKVAKRRLDMITGNVSSYARCLNDSKRLKQIQEVNQLTATVAAVTADIAKEKELQKIKAAQKTKAAKAKKAEENAKEAIRREEKLPKITLLMQDFETERRDLTLLATRLFAKDYLIDILKYYYNARPVGAQSMSKAEVYNELVKCFEAANSVVPL